jgi:hypothetical protein
MSEQKHLRVLRDRMPDDGNATHERSPATISRTKGIEQTVRKNDGVRQPKQIRTDADCRRARSKLNKREWSSAKIYDVTGGGLYLFATPDEGMPDNAASKL